MSFDFATAFPTVEPARQKAIGWWQGRSPREQWLLGGLAALLAVWLGLTQIVQPVLRARAEAQADIRTYAALNARLQGAGPLTAAPAQASGPPAAILSTTGAQFGIVAVVNAEGSGFRVTVGEAPYDAVLRWIAAFEQSSRLRVTRMRLDRRPSSGLVSAELMVRA